MIAKRIQVYGHVQGVGFRRASCREAGRLGVTGWVRNRHDGSVEIQVQGELEAVTAMEVWSRSGSPRARVDKLEIAPSTPESLSGFCERETG